MNPELLKSLLEDDDLGLLDVKTKSSAPTADEHLVNGFNAINEFIAANGREPEANMSNVSEYMLSARLQAIRSNTDQSRVLNDYDFHGLLPQHVDKPVHSIADIMGDDDLGLLGGTLKQTDDIFTMKHVKPISRAEADHISKRKQCKDFDQYKELFKKVHQEIREGKRKLLEFHDTDEQLVAGKYYVLNGILLLLDKVLGDNYLVRTDDN